MSGQLLVIRKTAKTPEGFARLDVTSHNSAWRQFVSPFYLGPVTLTDGSTAALMENAWQFSKVYDDMVDCNGNPNGAYFQWRAQGFADTVAHRHPHAGKPLYSWFNGQKLGYIEARKKIYIPCYAECIMQRDAGIKKIIETLNQGVNVALADFDGYNFKAKGMTYEDVIECPDMIMGHGHVLAMMIERPDLIERLLAERYS